MKKWSADFGKSPELPYSIFKLKLQHVYVLYTVNGTDKKRQIQIICCKWKTEKANFHLFAAN
jgi:hypothetical protein